MLRCGITTGMNEFIEIVGQRPSIDLCCQSQMRHPRLWDANSPPTMNGRHRSFDQSRDGRSAAEVVDNEISRSVHEARYAMIANSSQVAFCDISDCDNRRVLVHAPMEPTDIKAELRRRNMSQRDLADAVGMSENHLSKSLAGKRLFRLAEMDAIRAELAPEPEISRLRTIPLLGSVPAGKFRPAEQQGGKRIAISDPHTPPNAYALEVDGNSMDLVVPHGTTLIIDPDDKSLWPGRRYVVQTEEGETTFKEFQADPARLVPCSSDPSHQDILLGGEPVLIVGRVYSYSMRDADLPRRSL